MYDLTLKTDQQLQEILEEKDAKNTKRATKSTLKIFTDYLCEKGYPQLEDIEDLDLPDILFRFYGDLRRTDGEEYKLQSIKCIRAGLNRHTKAKRNLDIISDVRFTQANELFKGKSKVICKQGKGSTRPTPIIF